MSYMPYMVQKNFMSSFVSFMPLWFKITLCPICLIWFKKKTAEGGTYPVRFWICTDFFIARQHGITDHTD